MKAFYTNIAHSFLKDDADSIIGKLSTRCAAYHYELKNKLIASWDIEIEVLTKTLCAQAQSQDISNWGLLLEYQIPRRSKRIDAVLLAPGIIFVLEFKCNGKAHTSDAIAQVEDYCLDIRDFHKESRKSLIVPVVVTTHAPDEAYQTTLPVEQVLPTIKTNAKYLTKVISTIVNAFGDNSIVNPTAWENSTYEPTPTILETAQQLFAKQSVKEITRSHAGAENLTITTQHVLEAIKQAQIENRKLICFITGVPGAGKTLAGLNIIHSPSLNDGKLGAFLSGNIPLVQVLSEALARDEQQRTRCTLKQSKQRIETFIQTTQNFLRTHYASENPIPPDKIIVFDEAQRAWNKERTKEKYGFDVSQPQMILEIMDRHTDWAVVIALIGGGQEINTGEAGLSEWGRALIENHPHWKIFISNELKEGHHATGGQCLFTEIPNHIQVQESPALHLKVSLRSYKAEKLSLFIEELLLNNPEEANSILKKELNSFPIGYTRSLSFAREWLKERQRGSRRIGLVASSGARRLKAHGINVKNEIDPAIWLLNPANDIRSSHFLEDAATEFSIQGLELDWTGICWGGDFSHTGNNWSYKKFSGTNWQNVHKTEIQQFILNKYRVLLSRAREGLIIWIPYGSESDPTRPLELYDGTADYFDKIGIPQLDLTAKVSATPYTSEIDLTDFTPKA